MSIAVGVVVLDSSLVRVDEFIHIRRRMRTIVLQSAVGGMALSMVGMGFAATGHLGPVQGEVVQEIIDVAAVLNALRAAFDTVVRGRKRNAGRECGRKTTRPRISTPFAGKS